MLAEIKGRVQDAAAHTPAARRTRIDRVVGAAVAAILALGLGSAGAAFAFGILPQAPEDDPMVEPSTRPTASATPERTFPVETAPPAPDPGPTPRIGLTCDDLVDTTALVAFLGDAGQPLAGPATPSTVPASAGSSPADRAVTEQLGALECSWWSETDDPAAADAGRQTVSLRVLPEGIDEAIRYVDTYQLRDPTYGSNVQGPRCVSAGGIGVGYCELFGVIGSNWVELYAVGIVAADVSDEELRASFRALTDPLVERLGDASIADRWVPRAPSPVAASGCDTIAPSEAIAPLVGVAELRVAEMSDGPRVGQYWYAKNQLGARHCTLYVDGDVGFGSIGVLPNGAWATSRYEAAWVSDGAATIELPGASNGSGLLRCDEPRFECRLDFTVGDDWVSIIVPPAPHDEEWYREPFERTRTNIVAIATIVAERIAAMSK
ncbi:hypothetical protein [Agromyces mariniharenae]|uniref:DUF3558 domain-containing protein n=1 Tax=Agromyces mariniharenae TaxID=2604423 RepID=A0A5S4V3Q5_9MICO|nr:hypothetical protein [Agromyces mariniharenae]TYL51140.1 hypothetical protein FYC51_18655 [Agromyces mariniharenae]